MLAYSGKKIASWIPRYIISWCSTQHHDPFQTGLKLEWFLQRWGTPVKIFYSHYKTCKHMVDIFSKAKYLKSVLYAHYTSTCRWSPRCEIICPMQAMARSLTSWSRSAALNLANVQWYRSPVYGVKSKDEAKSSKWNINLLALKTSLKFNTKTKSYMKTRNWDFNIVLL